MRLRGPVRFLAVALFASLLSPVVLRPTPALADGPCTTNADDSTADPTPTTWSDGTKVRFRIVRPTQSGTGTCPTKPANGWPLIVVLHGGSGNRCFSLPFYGRSTTAPHGYVVLSFTARGKPGPLNLGSGSAGCNATDDGVDALDDNGSGAPESRDLKDISQLIDWVLNNNSFSGCASPCADTNNVGVTGYSWGGPRTLWMGVPAATNPDYDSRVKAIAPVASQLLWRTLKNQSSDGAATPTARPRATGTWGNVAWWFNQGWFGHWTRDYSKHANELHRAEYLNLTVPTDTETYWDNHMLIDDDSAVDKVEHITMPTFVITGWLDGAQGIYNNVLVEAWNKIPATNKYLYLGSCGHTPDPCYEHPNNQTKMRDALHRFFDKHLKGATTAVGGPIFYTVPPKWTSSTSNPWTPTGQTWTESTASAWPPSGSATYTTYLRNDGTLKTTAESGTTCTPGTNTGCREIDNLVQSLPPIYDFCYNTTYGSTEAESFTTDAFTGDAKLGDVEADLYLKTDTTRLQVYVDLYVTNGSGTDLARIWQGEAQVAPVKRDATAGTVYRFKFKPGGAAWTVGNGQKLRVKVTSKYTLGQAAEYLPGIYTLYHNATYPSSVKVTFVP